jgi:hypothetical protein
MKRKLLPLSGYMGGGGDSGGGGAQTSTSYNTNIPEYARPYVETMLGTAQQQIFDYGPSEAQYEDVPIYGPGTGYGGQSAIPGVGNKIQIGTEKRLIPGSEGAMVPKGLKAYQPFNEDPSKYFAGFSPLQQQSQQGAANMTAAPQLSGATGMAAEAGLRGLDTRYSTGQFGANTFDQGAAQQYMNPYMQSVVEMQQQDAQRQADIASTGRNAQATQAGAFGGSRQAIMDAEAARNLASQKGSIQSQGLNTAYGQAQQQFNADQARRQQAQQMYEQSRQYGAGLGMQGLQTALQGAGQLGQLGGQQFQQGMDINKLQNQMGSQQQQAQQNILNQQIQNYATAQQYPMQQLSNMSNLLRGMPMQSTTVQGYQAQPNALSQLGGLGLTGAAIAGLGKAKGGRIKENKRPAGLAELALMKMR